MPHEIQQSPGQSPSTLWEILAAVNDSAVAEVLDASMKSTLLGCSNPSDELGESTTYRSTTSSADSIPISNGPQPWFVDKPSYVVNSDVVPGSCIILPPGYVEEFDEFTCNESARMDGVGYDDGVNTLVQVMQPGGRESSLWSPSGSDSTTAPGSLLTIATPAAAAIPPTTLSDPWSFEPTHFYGLESSQPFHPLSVSPFSLATDMYGMPCCFPQSFDIPLDSLDTSTI
ncbi:hypothetical protein CEP54_013057 [Fusarium duplospermum]|uniref:Uncharacterized protein n=1 Tax=Fusarium duplospermum TaxID=1325734 RepID=A0A428P538_9HYPO|nr:hypothetical protein CEP54_013057 [Fusarium duplospermum]